MNDNYMLRLSRSIDELQSKLNFVSERLFRLKEANKSHIPNYRIILDEQSVNHMKLLLQEMRHDFDVLLAKYSETYYIFKFIEDDWNSPEMDIYDEL